MSDERALEIANGVAFAARMAIRSAKGPRERSKAIGAEEAALQIVKALSAPPSVALDAGAVEQCSNAVKALKIKHAGKDAGAGYHYNRTLDEAIAAIRALTRPQLGGAVTRPQRGTP